MAQIILITGGARSGKSSYALTLGEGYSGRRTFIATSQVVDDEMSERISRHREERKGLGFETIEKSFDLSGAIARSLPGLVIVDCLTLWISNLFELADREKRDLWEDDVAVSAAELVSACREKEGTVIFVTNEVGMGIVPPTQVGRVYRDLLGRCNQVVARESDTVYLMVSGLPVKVKG